MRPFKSSIFWAKTTSLCLCLAILLCFWAAPVVFAADNGEFEHPNPPLPDGSSPRPFTWDNDVTICEGPVQGGISLASDASGSLYAVRCSTWIDSAHACINVYKSTDAGESWSFVDKFATWPGSYSHPVILTGGPSNRLYVFYLNSYHDGDIRMACHAQAGLWESFHDVKADADTITYFSACTDLGIGDHLMVVYERQEMGDNTPDLYSIVSTDQGETWSSEVKITEDGSHPDVAYGNDGYLYCVHEKTGGSDTEIAFIRSSDYGISWDLGTGEYLTGDSYDDSYPKVAALHTLPADSPYVWVAYNQENLAGTDIDLAYAYSYNGGKDWSKNHILDSTSAYHEMACDLWTKQDPDYHYVHVCYFVGRYVLPFPRGAIYYGHASSTNPTNWGFLFGTSNHWPTQSEDGRKICQGTYAPGSGFMGAAIMYAGKDPDEPFGDNFRNLWFDNSAWPTDIEEEMPEEEVPAEFSLSTNYPNPFNPQTRICYFIPKASHVRLEIFNILGQKVRTLVDEEQTSGKKEVTWDGKDESGSQVASGVYLYKLEAGNSSQSNKMVLMR